MAKSDQLTFRVRPELRAVLDRYLLSHKFPPPMGDVLTKALEEFLDREGFTPTAVDLPPPPAKKKRGPK